MTRPQLGKAGLSTHMIEVHAHTVEDFSQTVLLHAEPPRGILDLTLADIQSYLNEKPGKQPVTSFKRFVRFLINTGRIDYKAGEEMYDVLKHMSKGS